MIRPAFPLVIFALVCAGLWAFEYHSRHWGYVALGGSFFAVATVSIYYLLLGLSMASVLVRAVFAIIPVGMFSGGFIYAILQIDALDVQTERALIAAVIVAGGWIVGYMTAEWRRVGIELERRRDIIRAVFSELELISQHAGIADWDDVIVKTQQKFRSTKYRSFIYYGHQYATLKRLVEQIEVLNWDQIPPVMTVFQALDRLDRMAERMEGDQFDALPSKRREEGIVRYLRLHGRIEGLSNNAIHALRDAPFRGWLGRLS